MKDRATDRPTEMAVSINPPYGKRVLMPLHISAHCPGETMSTPGTEISSGKILDLRLFQYKVISDKQELQTQLHTNSVTVPLDNANGCDVTL